MQYGIKELQWFQYFKVVLLETLNMQLCRVFANQVTIDETDNGIRCMSQGNNIMVLVD